MPLTGNIPHDIKEMRHAGHPQRVAVAAAMNAAKPSRRQRRNANKKKYATEYTLPSYQEGGSVAIGSDNTIIQIIADEFSRRGLDWRFAVGVALAESDLNPSVPGDGGASIGLFQLHRDYHQQPFYAAGYTNLNDPRQQAAYVANYVANTRSWNEWYGAGRVIGSGWGSPQDGTSYNGPTYTNPLRIPSSQVGGGGSVSQPPVGASNPPASTGGQYDNFTREQWAYMAAAQMGPKPAQYTDAQWQYMALARGDQLREQYFAGQTGSVSPPGTSPGTYDPSNPPGLPVTGAATVHTGDGIVGRTITVEGLGTGVVKLEGGKLWLYRPGDAEGGTAANLTDYFGNTGANEIQVSLDTGEAVRFNINSGRVSSVVSGGSSTGGGGSSTGGGGSSTGGGGTSSSTSTSTSYNTSEYGPVQADIAREQNRIDAERVRVTEELGKVQNDIAMIQAYTDASSQNRLRGLEEQKFQYQQQLNELDYQMQLLEYAATVRAQDISLRGQDISVIMAQLDAETQGRGQDVQMRGQDFQAQIEGINSQIAYWSQQRQAARDRNDAQGMRDAEERMRAEMRNRNILTQREQDIAVRNQDIDAALGYGSLLNDQWREEVSFAKYTGDFKLQKHAEERLYVASQQNAALAAHKSLLDAAALGIDAQTAAANNFGDLAKTENDWQKFLANSIANPRDFPQYFAALGRGKQFIDSLLSGKPFEGMTIGNIGETPLVSSPWAELGESLQNKPAFDAAMAANRRLEEMAGEIPEGMSIEDILAMGDQVSPIGEAPTMPEAPTLPNPMDVSTPPPLEFSEPPPQSEIVEPPQGPGVFTEAMAEKEIRDKMAAARAAGQPPTVAQIRQWTLDAQAKIGQTDWTAFVAEAPPVQPLDTSVSLPEQPGAPVAPADALPFPERVPAQPPVPGADVSPPGTPAPPVTLPPAGEPPSGEYADWAEWESVPHPPGEVNPFPAPGSGQPPLTGPAPATTPTLAPPPVVVNPHNEPSVPPPPVISAPTHTGSDAESIALMNAANPGWYDQWNAQRTQYGGRKRVDSYDMGGKEQLISEPTTAYGDITGEPKFTLGEQTPGFPEGIPETAEVSPDGTSVDIQPFGQDPYSAVTTLLEDTRKRMREARGNYDEMRNIMAETQQAMSAIMRNGKKGESGMDEFRAKHGVFTPKEQDFMKALPPAAGAEVSPQGMPPPEMMSSLMGNAKTVMQGKKKLKDMASLVAGRR